MQFTSWLPTGRRRFRRKLQRRNMLEKDPEMWMQRLTIFRKPMRKGKCGRVANIDVILLKSTLDVIHLVP